MSILLGEGTYGTIAVEGRGAVKVGKYCSLASGIKAMFLQDHRVDWVSTYPFPVLWRLPISGHPVSPENIIVGNDVWIGANVILLGGAEIGDGAVVGAYSVVSNRVSEYSVIVGNPAKVIRKRFSEEVINRLLEIKWWDWPKEKVKQNVELICSPNVEKFVLLFQGS